MTRALGTMVGVALVLLLVLAGPARADNVDVLVKDLSTGADYKVRVSAAIGLTNQKDQRGVTPMVNALKDPDKNVRATAAAGLGKLVTSATTATLKTRALAELDKLKADPSTTVQAAAAKSAALIRGIGAAGASGGAIPSGAVVVVVMPVVAGSGVSAGALPARMTKAASTNVAGQKVMTTPVVTNVTPTAAQITSANATAFQLTGTLTALTTTVSGANATVKCGIKLVLSTFPSASMFGFLDSSASVQGPNTPTDIQYASEDCVDAVMDGLVKKVMATIKTRTGKP